jgi:hypothetical protein
MLTRRNRALALLSMGGSSFGDVFRSTKDSRSAIDTFFDRKSFTISFTVSDPYGRPDTVKVRIALDDVANISEDDIHSQGGPV